MNTRAYLRRLSILNGLSVSIIWMFALGLHPENIRSVSPLVWTVNGAAIIFMIAGIVDVLVVYYLVRKIQPYARVDASVQAFIRGTRWSELRQLTHQIGSTIEQEKRMFAEAAAFPALAGNLTLRRLIQSGQYVRADLMIKREREREALQTRRAEHRRGEDAHLVRTGVGLGIPEEEMRSAVSQGNGAARISEERAKTAVLAQAKKLGLERLIVLCLADGSIAARAQLAHAADMLAEAASHDVRPEVARLLGLDSLEEAEQVLQTARERAALTTTLDSLGRKIEFLPQPSQPSARALLDRLRTTRYGTRPYRIALHELEQML